ncbi:hypothetical protein [Methylobacter marinus]|uniref:hypothetical protein n=1 Tax=Methylobacter marinus TaxID=34058 RepID=UPI000379E0AA|nr:hypothetical protein [Methylobacter marinus]
MDTKRLTSIAGDVAIGIFVPDYVRAIYSALSDSQSDVKAAESKGIPTLEEEARKQQILMEFQAHQARVAQELAIAERISVSSEVEIEEYYDISGKGHAGAKAEKEAVSFGVGGEGRRVTKRIIRFSGWNTSELSEGEAQPDIQLNSPASDGPAG